MKKYKLIVCLIAAVLMSLTFLMTSSAVGEGMAHNVYTEPDLSAVNGQYDAFMIDFMTESEEAFATYWALANWKLDVKESIKENKWSGLDNPSGYCGIQNCGPNNRTKIFSVWEYKYTDVKTHKQVTLNAKRIYPAGEDRFGNEGSGVNCIRQYKWKDHQWYRMLLMAWDDVTSGTTMIGTWLYDYTNDCWEMIAYYDTHLVSSFFIGNPSQFMENFSAGDSAKLYRSFNYRNFYVISHETKKWVSTPKINISGDFYQGKIGIIGGGVSDDGTCITGFADGASDDDYKYFSKSYTITQEDNPSYGKPELRKISSNKNKGKTVIKWDYESNSTPQMSYSVKVYDENDILLAEDYQTRPEIKTLTLDSVDTDMYRVVLEVVDVFGQKTSGEYKTKEYRAAKGELEPDTTGEVTKTAEPDQTSSSVTTPDVTKTSGNTAENGNNSDTAVIIVIAAAAVIAAGATVFIIIRKKKK